MWESIDMKQKTMVTILAAMLTIGFGLTFSGCGASGESAVVAPAETEAVTETPEPAATETPAPEPTETETPTPTPTPTEEPEEELKTIGSPDGKKVFTCAIKNVSGKGIKGVAIKLDSESSYPGNLMEKDDVFEDGEERILHYDAADALRAYEKAQREADQDAPLITPGYTMQITYEDDVKHELHAFPFGDVEEAELHTKDNYSYIVYHSAQFGDEVNTEESEKMMSKGALEAAAVTPEPDAYEYVVEEEITYQPAPQEIYEEPVDVQVDEIIVYEEPVDVYEMPAEEPYVEPADDPNAGCLGDDGLTY